MSREIKFRVWDSLLKKYAIDTEDAHLYQDEDFLNGIFRVCAYREDDVVEQYTGLKDRNGKEIYEGDIVKVEFDANIIKLKKGKEIMGLGLAGEIQRRHTFKAIEWSGLGFKHFKTVSEIGSLGNETVEVVGNIHENKELLEE